METILLVEDDPSNLMVISSILRRDGYNVVEADRGTAAACVCRKLQPDLLVSDIALPDLSGTEVASQAVECFPEMPVLFISGTPVDGWSAADQSNFKRLSAKMVGFLEKPFLPTALCRKVRDLLNRLPHV